MLSDNCGISFHRGIVLPTCLGRRKGWGWLDKARLLLQGAGPLARWQGGVLPEISQQGPSGPTPIRDWGEWDKFSGRAQHLLFAEALGAARRTGRSQCGIPTMCPTLGLGSRRLAHL